MYCGTRSLSSLGSSGSWVHITNMTQQATPRATMFSIACASPSRVEWCFAHVVGSERVWSTNLESVFLESVFRVPCSVFRVPCSMSCVPCRECDSCPAASAAAAAASSPAPRCLAGVTFVIPFSMFMFLTVSKFSCFSWFPIFHASPAIWLVLKVQAQECRSCG